MSELNPTDMTLTNVQLLYDFSHFEYSMTKILKKLIEMIEF